MRKSVPVVPQRQVVTFRVGEVELGLEVGLVHEVIRYGQVTAIPRAPSFVEGMIDLRGTLIPLVDLRRRFDVADPTVDAETRVMIVDTLGERMGLVADRVTEVLRVPETAFSELPGYLRTRVADAVDAVARLPDRPILMLELDRLLSTEERVALRDLEVAIQEVREADEADEADGGAEPAPGGGGNEPGGPAEERAT